MPRKTRLILVLLVLPLGVATESLAWFTDGHSRVAAEAVGVLPERVPEFFRLGAEATAHSAVDPDLEKHRALPELRIAESPEHYLDRERVGQPELPRSRYAFIDRVRREGFTVVEVGTLPYALLEGTQRLALAFAEYRRWPDNPHVRSRVAVYAGELSHYAADLCQPLHTTIHHDGRARQDGTSPFSGIHRRVDGLFERDVEGWDRDRARPRVIDDLHRAIVTELMRSHGLVDRVYELEPLLEGDRTEGDELPPEVEAFARHRFEASVRFTSSLFLYAWDRSAALELPSWHDRGREEGGTSR